jgi:hypothetical protein
MIGWNHCIEMECVEELPLARCQPTHHVLPPTLIVSAHRITLHRPHQRSFATQSVRERTALPEIRSSEMCQ